MSRPAVRETDWAPLPEFYLCEMTVAPSEWVVSVNSLLPGGDSFLSVSRKQRTRRCSAARLCWAVLFRTAAVPPTLTLPRKGGGVKRRLSFQGRGADKRAG